MESEILKLTNCYTQSDLTWEAFIRSQEELFVAESELESSIARLFEDSNAPAQEFIYLAGGKYYLFRYSIQTKKMISFRQILMLPKYEGNGSEANNQGDNCL